MAVTEVGANNVSVAVYESYNVIWQSLHLKFLYELFVRPHLFDNSNFRYKV